MRCHHEYDDGAYVLGALSPAERTAYERHLATCSFCREAVADIAVLPGLLGRLTDADLAALLEPDRPRQRDRMPELVVAAKTVRRQDRRRVRWRTLAASLAAASLALVAGLGAVFWLDRGAPPLAEPSPPSVAMQPVSADIPVNATLTLTGTKWGTKVDMTCFYAKADSTGQVSAFRLVAYGADDVAEPVGSWTAAPGAEVSMSGMTRFTGNNLSRLALLRHDGKTLLTYNVS